MNPVAAGFSAHQQQGVAHCSRRRRRQVSFVDQANTHGVDQGVFRVAAIEVDLPGHVGHPYTVAVPGDASHHTLKQVPVSGLFGWSEPQGVEQGDGPGAHGQDVPDDAAHARGSALQGLYRRWVVVRLDLENGYDSVPQVHRAGVFGAGLGHDPGRPAGEQPQQRPGVLVAAVLAPQSAEHAQLNRIGFPVQPVHDQVIFGPGQGDFVQLFLGYCHYFACSA